MGQLLSALDVYYGHARRMEVVGSSGDYQLGCVALVAALYRGRKMGVDVGPVD